MNLESFSYRLLAVFMVFFVTNCSSVTKDKYILPNGYRGFFGVLYQSDSRLIQIIKDGERIFSIANNGVCESGFSFAKGPIKQEFFYQNKRKIESFDFALFYQMKDQNLIYLNKKSDSLFAICFYADNIKGGKESFNIYLVANSDEIIRLQKNVEEIFFYLNSMNFDWQENKESMVMNVARLNKELAEKKPPFN